MKNLLLIVLTLFSFQAFSKSYSCQAFFAYENSYLVNWTQINEGEKYSFPVIYRNEATSISIQIKDHEKFEDRTDLWATFEDPAREQQANAHHIADRSDSVLVAEAEATGGKVLEDRGRFRVECMLEKANPAIIDDLEVKPSPAFQDGTTENLNFVLPE